MHRAYSKIMDYINGLSSGEIAAILHFYRYAGVDWLSQHHPIDRIAEFSATSSSMQTAEPSSKIYNRESMGAQAKAKRQATPNTSPTLARPVAIPDERAIEEALEAASHAGSIPDLVAALTGFSGCNLRNSAKSTAFVDGDRQARIMVLGPVASADDDRDGVPFAGKNGDVLEKMLNAIGLSRKTVLMANAIAWRPPGNRAPSKPEMDICRPFIERLIALAHPDAILIVGHFTARFFLDANGSIHSLRGRWLDVDLPGIAPVKALATFHPLDIVQAPLNKALVWSDLQKFSLGLKPQG